MSHACDTPRCLAEDAVEQDLFSASTFAASERGHFSASSDFAPSQGPWASGLNEQAGSQAVLTHTQPEPRRTYTLRAGVGGQVDSLAGAFGQSVPPSWRAGDKRSPWNDEVWQFVAVVRRYDFGRAQRAQWGEAIGLGKTTYFLHNSGCHIPQGLAGVDNISRPLLGASACAVCCGNAAGVCASAQIDGTHSCHTPYLFTPHEML